MTSETAFTIAAWTLMVVTYAGTLSSIRYAKLTYPTQVALTLGFVICWSALDFSGVNRETVASWISGFAIANAFLIGRAIDNRRRHS